MRRVFDLNQPYEAFLEVRAPGSEVDRLTLTLSDEAGNSQSSEVILRLDRRLPKSAVPWSEFLARYREGDTTDGLQASFGRDLFDALIREHLPAAWNALRAASDGRPLSLTVDLGSLTERLSSLPL